MNSRTTKYAFYDVFTVSLIFTFFLLIKPGAFLLVFPQYFPSFLLFIVIWATISLAIDKYNILKGLKFRQIIQRIFLANLLIVGISTTLMYLVRVDFFSRTVVFGTIITATVAEIIWATIYYFVYFAYVEPSQILIKPAKRKRFFLKDSLELAKKAITKKPELKSREDAILVEISEGAFEFIFSYARIDSPKTLIISTTTRFNITSRLEKEFESVVNLKRINDIRYINKFFEAANSKLPVGGLFIDFVESKDLRKKRILRKYPPIINYIAYTIDFIIKRIFPKFFITKNIYFLLTRGQNRVLSKAETFGRLYSCGFEIVDEKLISNHLFFIARKISEPLFPAKPTYGPLVKLERIGYNGQTIKVYKFRTMHPFAEYLQEYVYEREGLQEGGKFKSDFRISTLGRIMRTFWLDELPMVINLFKSEIKLVGVRPLSRQYLSLYSKDFRKRRIAYRPGLIPPFYADNPKTIEEILESEKRYLDAYDKHPFWTDVKYFFEAVFNIIFKKYRSK